MVRGRGHPLDSCPIAQIRARKAVGTLNLWTYQVACLSQKRKRSANIAPGENGKEGRSTHSYSKGAQMTNRPLVPRSVTKNKSNQKFPTEFLVSHTCVMANVSTFITGAARQQHRDLRSIDAQQHIWSAHMNRKVPTNRISRVKVVHWRKRWRATSDRPSSM